MERLYIVIQMFVKIRVDGVIQFILFKVTNYFLISEILST